MVDELNQEVKSKKRSLLGWLIDKIAPKKKQDAVSNSKKEVKKVSPRRENNLNEDIEFEQFKEKNVSSVLKSASFAVVTTSDPKSYSPIPQNREKLG